MDIKDIQGEIGEVIIRGKFLILTLEILEIIKQLLCFPLQILLTQFVVKYL